MGLGMGEYCRPCAPLVFRWEKTGSKGHLIQRKGSLAIWLTERVHGVICAESESAQCYLANWEGLLFTSANRRLDQIIKRVPIVIATNRNSSFWNPSQMRRVYWVISASGESLVGHLGR